MIVENLVVQVCQVFGYKIISIVLATSKLRRQKPMILEVYNPAGAIEITEVHAPRLQDLRGKTICELSDRLWEDFRIFPRIRELLEDRFPDLNVIPYTEFPNIYGIEANVLIEKLKNKGVQAAIVGTAA
jgi:hypothetical protein